MPFSASTTGRTGALSVALVALILAGAAPSARAAAPGGFTAPDDPAVPGLIAGLRGCVSGLAAPDRRVLALRSGLGGHAPQSSAQVGATLGESTAAATAAEVVAIRRLEAARRRGACQVQPTAAQTRPAAATTHHAQGHLHPDPRDPDPRDADPRDADAPPPPRPPPLPRPRSRPGARRPDRRPACSRSSSRPCSSSPSPPASRSR